MTELYSEFTFIDFLKDDRFLSWQLLGVEEDELFWAHFFDNCPEKQRMELEKAIRLFRNIKLNDTKLDSNNVDVLYSQIKQSIIYEKRKKSLWVKLRIGIAAGILILFGATFYFSGIKNMKNEGSKVEVANFKDSTRNNSKDILLVLSNEETVVFDSDAKIKYDSSGKVTTTTGTNNLPTIVENNEKSKLNKLIVPKGKRSTLELADGTKVWVNSGSTLEFPSVFNADNREIFVEGEIYIEVEKNINKPFLVNTSNFKIQVLGTRFNVSAYREDKIQSVVLVLGSVSVKTKVNGDFLLKPDQMLSMADNSYELKTVDVYDYISWKDGLFQFKSTNLGRVSVELSRYFDIPVICPPELETLKCTGKLVLFDDLDSILFTLREILPIDFKKENDKIQIISRTHK